MKQLALFAVLSLTLAAQAGATEPYFGLIGSKRVGFQTEQLALIPIAGGPTSAALDVVLVAHSTSSWSIVPQAWQNVIAPENWGLLAGCGGNSTSADCNLSVAVNVAPQLASMVLGKVGTQTNPIAKAVSLAMTDGLALGGSASLGFAMSYSLGGNAVKNGVCQSLPEIFHYRGMESNLYHASYVGVGTALKFL